MRASDSVIDIIRHYEGCKLTAYLCPAKVWTVGFGHTGKGIVEWVTITQEQAEDYLREDLILFENFLNSMCDKAAITLKQHEFDACISLMFNIGQGAFKSSTVWRMVVNQRPASEIDKAFMMWVYANSKTLSGLVARRKTESLLYRENRVEYFN